MSIIETMAHRPKYRPGDFQSPVGQLVPYLGTFDNYRFHWVAASIISPSQALGRWQPIPGFDEDPDVVPEMVQAGLLEKLRDGYMLTDKALDRIFERYPARPE
jgi:hypothetical protein